MEHFKKVLFKQRVQDKAGNGVTYLQESFSFREPDIYGEETVVGVDFSYTIVDSSIQKILGHSGLFQPVGQDWRQWSQSLQDSALNPYGYSKIIFDVGTDPIIDLCKASQANVVNAAKQDNTELRVGPLLDPPQTGNSWLLYRNFLRVEGDSGVMTSQPLSTAKQPEPPLKDAELKGGFLFDGKKPVAGKAPAKPGGFFNPPPRQNAFQGLTGGKIESTVARDSTQDLKFTRRSSSNVVIYMTGYAVRAGFSIPCPTMTSVNGVPAVNTSRKDRGEEFVSGIIRYAGNVPIVGAKWNLRYELPYLPPGEVPVPPDPTVTG